MEVAELSVRVTTDDQLSKTLEKTVDQSARKVEARTRTMGERIQTSLATGLTATSLFKNLGNLFGRETKRLEKQAEQSSNNIAATFAKIGLGFAGGLAFESAISQFRNLETKTRETLTLLESQSNASFQRLTGDVLEFQEALRISTEDAVPALYQAISAGQGDDPFGFLEVAREAAIGGVSDLSTAVGLLSGTVNAYQDEAVDAALVSDVLFTAVKLGVTTFGELAQALPNVTSTAAALGVSVEETAAAVAQLTKTGIDSSRSANFLNQALIELAKSGTEAQKTFTDLTGQTFQEFIAEGNTIADVITLIADASRETGLSVLDMFGSVEAGRAVLALTSDEGVGLNETLEAMQGSFGATSRAAETMSASSEQTRLRISALIQTAQQTFGAQVAPFIQELLLQVEDLLPAVIDLAGAMGGAFAIAFNAAVPILSLVTGGINLLVSGLSAIPAPLLSAVFAWQAFNNILTLVPTALGLIGGRIPIVAAGLKALSLESLRATAAGNGLSASLARVGVALRTTSLALPLIGIGLAAVAWKAYGDSQEAARQRAVRWGEVMEATVPPTETVEGRVQALKERFDELAASIPGATEEVADAIPELEALLAVVESLGSNQLDLVSEFAAWGGSIEDAALIAADGADDFEGLRDSLVGVYPDGRQLDRFREQIAAASPEVAALGDQLLEYAIAEQGAFGDAAVVGRLRGLLQVLEQVGEARDDNLATVEAELEADIRLAAATEDYAKALVNSAAGIQEATGSQTPFLDALEATGQRTAELQLEFIQTSDAVDEYGNATGRAASAGEIALAQWEEMDDGIEEMNKAYGDIIPTLTDVDNVLDSITDGLRAQFNIGLSARQATQELDAAYEDLTESLGGFVGESEESADKLAELTAAYEKEIKSGIGPKAKALEAEIKAERDAQKVREDGLRTLSDYTDEGREAFNILTEYSDAVLDNAEAQLDQGESLSDVQSFLEEQEELLAAQAEAAGVSTEALSVYQEQLDLTPDTLETLIDLVGADAAVQDIAGVLNQLESVPDEVKAEIALLGSDASLQQILEIVSKLDEFSQIEATARLEILNAEQAASDLRDVTDALIDVTGYPPDIPFEVSVTGNAAAELRNIVDNLIEVTGYPPDIPFEVSTSTTGDELGDINETIGEIPETLAVEVSLIGGDTTIQDLTEVELKALDVENSDPEIDVVALTDAAIGDLDEVLALLQQIDGSTVTTTIITQLQGGGLPGAEAGGVFDVRGAGVPVRIGESGREYAIPVANPKYRDSARSLLAAAARDLGMVVSRPQSEPAAATQAESAAAPAESAASDPGVVEVRVLDYSDKAPMARRIALDLEELIGLELMGL